MAVSTFEHVQEQPENPFSSLPKNQRICLVPEFILENNVVLRDVPVAYKTFGVLNEERDNVMVICHAFTGSSDVSDWWGALLGPGKAFDISRFFIFCGNVLGSPYGTASPCTQNPETGKIYGADFPTTTIRDDIRLHKKVLDSMGIKSVAICIGGSLGGMQALEWAMLGRNYVRHLVAIATSGRHSAWGISWGEAQRQTIYNDPKYKGGNYSFSDPPKTGLAAARMQALLTYRSAESFKHRFDRKCTPIKDAPQANGEPAKQFSAQSYLQYQGNKFVSRFDANCYVKLTEKLDSHDLGAGRIDYEHALNSIQQPTVIVGKKVPHSGLFNPLGIESDGLFKIDEQRELANYIPGATLHLIESADGHDGFLLEFEQLNRILLGFINEHLSHLTPIKRQETEQASTEPGHDLQKPSMFGESEGGIVEW
ncbi:homoserine O- acetyltransferase [Entomophthora muscae]|uniref:Homoserine O- acetyltransferase n=1 Tax=Entomophthora muscae TaxID=34485 RepID=A0ACC2U6K7_9FUNG|nr:homoserine O- acetyltransferase [Entomophthora muscae]